MADCRLLFCRLPSAVSRLLQIFPVSIKELTRNGVYISISGYRIMDTELNLQHMEEVDYLTALLLKQLRQEITPEELQYLENWKAAHPSHALASEQVNDGEQLLADLLAMKQVDMEGWWQKISEQVEIVQKPVAFYRRWYTYAAAAVVLLVAGAITWQFITSKKLPQPANEKNAPAAFNIQPGGYKATLTLSDGSVINLVNASNGTVAEQGSVQVIKLKEGELKYESGIGPDSHREQSAITYNTLSTPRGGQYQLVLPDGSNVWLNAASSITYPTQFAANERRVAITGEAYFEVAGLPGGGGAKNGRAKKVPFIVTVQSPAGNNLARVEALGTQFNIMAYDNEAAIKTTLVNGKVMVSQLQAASQNNTDSYKLLTPGQQAQIAQHVAVATGRHPIKVIDIADTEEIDAALGWKNGYFTFNNADIKTIMRTLARWYDIETGYQGNIPDYKFTGSIPRKENISAVIKVLEYEGIHFKQEQNKIIVVP
jgi:transmembrane sensor